MGLDKVHPDWWEAFCKQRQLILETIAEGTGTAWVGVCLLVT